MNMYQTIIEFADSFKEALEGNPLGYAEFLNKIKESVIDIKLAMFYRKVSALMEELNSDKCKANNKKIGKILAQSDYGKEYGFVLLQYIDDYECIDKGRYLAHLLDSLSKEFISVQDCFTYARILKEVSLTGLMFIKNNLSTKTFSDNLELDELSRYNLVYRANEGGYAFELVSYYLDKFALSYGDEKYKYNGEKDFIPDRSQFPRKVAHLAISQGEPY